MASYRLLRSNKESGPYTLNDLVALGLKPYDLVWVDGRSAAWRYPSEVAELKDFAPAVEEQPYDRFYKKPAESETKEAPVARQQEIPTQRNEIKQPSFTEVVIPPQEREVKEAVIISQPEIKPIDPVKENPEKQQAIKNPIPEVPSYSQQQYQPQTQPRKQVFVSLPESNGFNPYQQETKKNFSEEAYQQYLPKSTQEKQKPVEKPYYSQQQGQSAAQKPSNVPRENEAAVKNSYFTQKEKAYSPIDIHESEEAKLETKYTQSLDDIKEMYINTLVQRKTRNRRKEVFRKYIKPAMAPLLLLVAGAALGYVITSKRNSSAVESVSQVVPKQAIPQEKDEQSTDEITDNTTPDNKVTDEKTSQREQTHSLVTNNRKNSRPQEQRLTVLYEKQNRRLPKAIVPERKEKQAYVPDNEVVNYQKKDVQVNPTTGERTRVVRDNDEITARENTSRNNNSERYSKKNDDQPNFIEDNEPKSIRDFISVKNNNYIRGAFGGIRGLELTVYNRSSFLVDEVSIELQIMRPSEQPLRTDVITVRNISANGAVTIRVPDSQRGIRVDYRVTNVESRQWQKSTAGL